MQIVAIARHHRFQRLAGIFRRFQRIGAIGRKQEVCIQRRQFLRAHGGIVAFGNRIDALRKAEAGIAQNLAQRAIGMPAQHLAIDALDDIDADRVGIDQALDLGDLAVIAGFERRQPALRAGDVGQHLVHAHVLMQAVVQHQRRRNGLQLLERRALPGCGQDQIGLQSRHRLHIGRQIADKGNVGIVKVDAGQHLAGADERHAVRRGAAMAANGRYAQLQQRHGDDEIMQRHDAQRRSRYVDSAAGIIGKGPQILGEHGSGQHGGAQGSRNCGAPGKGM